MPTTPSRNHYDDAMSNENISVIIVDDDQLVRHALVSFLKIAPDIKVMATFSRPEAGIEFLRRNPVNVALVDIHMPTMNGIQATKEIKATSPGTKVLILTSFDQDSVIQGALDAGAAGFLLKSTSPEALADAVRAVKRGLSVVSAGPMSRLRAAAPTRVESSVPELSEREREVLSLLCKGFSNLEIANDLMISESSVKSHVTALMHKLGVNSRLRAVVRAHELGFDGE